MIRYSVQPRDRIFVKRAKNIGKNINKSLSRKYSQKLRDHTKQFATDTLKTV